MHITRVAGLIGLSLLLLQPLSQAAEVGKDLYAGRCQGCHGADGKGNQAMAKALQANIPDLKSKEVVKIPEKELLEVLSKGRGKMPPAAGLREKELKDLVGYIKALGKGK